jgi:hypothetical protein
MDWQLWLVAACLTLSAAYLTRQTWRTLAGRKGCGGCGCAKRTDAATKPAAASTRIIPVEELTLRTRSRS